LQAGSFAAIRANPKAVRLTDARKAAELLGFMKKVLRT